MHLYIKKVLKKAKYCQFQYFKISVVMQKWLLCFLHHCIGADYFVQKWLLW